MKLVPVIAQPYFLEKVSRYRAGSPDRAKWIESLWQTPGGGGWGGGVANGKLWRSPEYSPPVLQLRAE